MNQQFKDTDDDDDEAAEEPDLDSGDGVGGGRGGPGDGQHVEQDHGDHQLHGQAEQGVGQQVGQPGDDHQDGGGQVEGENVGGQGSLQQYFNTIHAVVSWDEWCDLVNGLKTVTYSHPQYELGDEDQFLLSWCRTEDHVGSWCHR